MEPMVLDNIDIMSILEYDLQHNGADYMDIDQIDMDINMDIDQFDVDNDQLHMSINLALMDIDQMDMDSMDSMDTSPDNTGMGNIYHSTLYSLNNRSAETLPDCPNNPTNPNSDLAWLSYWSSPNSSSCSLTPASSSGGCSPVSGMFRTWLPGNLNKLPLDLHGLLSLRQVSKHTKALISAYAERNFTKAYLQGQLHDWDNPNCAKWYRSSFDAFSELTKPQERSNGLRNSEECDIITEVIVDDCPDCFNSLCKAIPGLSDASAGTNEKGWTFLAIAIRAGSYKMLERLFTMQSPYVNKALDLMGPSLLNHAVLGLTDSLLGVQEKAKLSTYISVHTAEWLTRLGIQLWTPSNGACSAWNSAVHNGPEFLEFLYKYDPDGLWSPANSITQPIQHAVLAGRLDSFRWILEKTKSHDLKGFRWIVENVGPVVADCTDPLSETMLEELLPEAAPRELNYYLAGVLFKNITTGMKETVLTQAARSDMDDAAYMKFRWEHEQRAIRKCHTVSTVFFDTGYVGGKFGLNLANSLHADAVSVARQCEFVDLERALYWYHGL
ncbi:hypothetical protein PENSTE_c023G06900 [Penicillium steckii]|uniref:Uncharacterized protein n=1 Tax=Penicillium steckii TaxID=303698 RepID=A0A1V6SRJ4_9EURO|nr:hypothetical protein PENSTE_c023G06900 [Penicillium steckii]